MRIAVCIRQVREVSKYLEFTPDGRQIDAAFVTTSVNEADLCAVEQALRLREAVGGEVVLLSVGEDDAEEALRAGLAMGAERAVRVWTKEIAVTDPVSVGSALAQAVIGEAPDLVLCGVQSSDTGQQSTGPVLAAAWGVPWITVAKSVDVEGSTLTAHREFEAGLTEIIEVDLPAVVTIQVGANEPRYGSFKEKVRAKKAEVPVFAPSAQEPPRTVVTGLSAAVASGGRDLEMIDGGPAEVAARILQLVREGS
jgi:electron transfer flavoprotein beta subunit